MSKSARSSLWGFLAILLIVAFTVAAAWGQDSSSDTEKQMRRVVGSWTLNPLSSEAPAPTPPPIYASYRKKDEPLPPALETVPRVFLEIKDGKLTGTVVLASALPMTDANRDVTGKEPVPLEDVVFDGTELKFKARQGEETFEGMAKLEGRVLKGTWRQGSEKQGSLYMHRRYR